MEEVANKIMSKPEIIKSIGELNMQVDNVYKQAPVPYVMSNHEIEGYDYSTFVNDFVEKAY